MSAELVAKLEELRQKQVTLDEHYAPLGVTPILGSARKIPEAEIVIGELTPEMLDEAPLTPLPPLQASGSHHGFLLRCLTDVNMGRSF